MTAPENNSSPSPPKESERESVFKVLDELVSHMYTFRNVAMLLIISAFVLVPISLVIAVLLLSSPEFVPGPEVQFIGTRMFNGTPAMINDAFVNSTSGVMSIRVVNGNMTEIGMEKLNTTNTPNEVVIQKGPNMTVGQIITTRKGSPNTIFYSPAGPPRFMVSGGPFPHQVLDISTIIIVFIAVSIVLSSIYLFIGIKEYSFFSRWNKKFSRYMSLRDKAEKELG
ncbi:hypothetical protein DYY67_0179 [Candidatus Nitrosotalea sp. TS]|uniref:hypothetical protein n=1 Tax=Candidatus Nitrosotalea sp. TS TaxID=2341020 RepID=UPI0014073293|nr:hypothetical protein [Candidatus Nitrosotalea sp. TS]NHI03058.1 hypothetical protein [Candidatus Nitrosotalea sp. TS]